MDKILNTQLNHIFSHIDHAQEEIEIASRLIAQAVIGEGNVYWKLFDDFSTIGQYVVEGTLAFNDSRILNDVESIQSPDRLIVVAKHFDEKVKSFIHTLFEKRIEFILISNYNRKESEFIDTIPHFLDLNSPREIIPTPNFDKIVNPYMSAFFYMYYLIYANVDEMTNDDY